VGVAANCGLVGVTRVVTSLRGAEGVGRGGTAAAAAGGWGSEARARARG